MMDRERLKEMSRFVVVGLFATAIQYGVYYCLLPLMNHNAAYTVGCIVSLLCNYGVSSRYTFRVGTSLKRFLSFGMSHLTNYFIQIILLNLFIWLGVGKALAPLPVYVLAVPINYMTVRFALTRREGENDGYWLFLMSVGFAMLWLQLLDVPTMSDDMIYRFLWHADSTAPVEAIDSLGDLLRSQWEHYTSTNGRLVPHLLAQLFLAFLPAVVMHVLHTLMFVLLVHLATSWATDGRREQRLVAAAIVTVLLFVVFSGLRTAMLWGLGAFNYLWPLVAVLALLLSLRRRVASGEGSAWLLLPLALVAGWSHEALSLPVSVAFAAWLAGHRRDMKADHVVTAAMLLFMLGTALILLSPGLWMRAGEGGGLAGRVMSAVMNCVSNLRVTYILAIALAVVWWRDRQALRRHVSEQRYEYIAMVAALAVVMACGVHLERVAFFAEFMAMLLLLRLLPSGRSASSMRWTVAVSCAVLLLFYVPAYMLRAENADNWHYAEQQMEEPERQLIAVRVPVKGDNMLVDMLRDRYVNPSFEFGFYCVYMGFDCEDVNERCAARLFGKERMTFLPDDVVRRMEQDSDAYSTWELDSAKTIFVWRMDDDRPVKGITFMLNDEDPATLMPHQRLVAYQGDSYELDDFHYEVVTVGGRHYLVFTKPTTNIYRRIKTIIVGH